MKKCPKCGKEQSISEFHKDKTKSSGRRSHCRTCVNMKSKNFRADNPEYMRNWLAENKGYHKQWSGEYGTYGREYAKRNRDKINKNREKYNNKWPEKVLARSIYVAAVSSGKLVREPCIVCGETKVDGHHEDYSKPLDIVWLCRKHHQLRHTEMKKGVVSCH